MSVAPQHHTYALYSACTDCRPLPPPQLPLCKLTNTCPATHPHHAGPNPSAQPSNLQPCSTISTAAGSCGSQQLHRSTCAHAAAAGVLQSREGANSCFLWSLRARTYCREAAGTDRSCCPLCSVACLLMSVSPPLSATRVESRKRKGIVLANSEIALGQKAPHLVLGSVCYT